MIAAQCLLAVASTFVAFWFAMEARCSANIARIEREAAEKVFALIRESNDRMDRHMLAYIEEMRSASSGSASP